MTTLYKLTSSDMLTRNNTHWGINITHKLPKKKEYTFCSGDVIHAYVSPNLATIMDCMHGKFLPKAILWECEGNIVINDGIKIGCTELTTLYQVKIPTITLRQKVTFAIKCVQHIYKDPNWNKWANHWLRDEDVDNIKTITDAINITIATIAANIPAIAAANAAYAAAVAAYANTAYGDADNIKDIVAYAVASSVVRTASVISNDNINLIAEIADRL